MEELKNHYSTNNNINLINQNNQIPLQDTNNFKNTNNTGEDNFYSSNEDIINYGENTFKDNNNKNPINIENKNIENKNLSKSNFNSDIYDRICLFINDIKEIDKVVPFCEEKNRKELLLDRGLLLCLKVNDIMDECDINIDNILFYKRNDNIEVDKKLLDENYWMNQKVDKYARTEQRKRIPQERWFMIKDNSFTPNLNKCFALNRGKFKDTYNWLNSLENK